MKRGRFVDEMEGLTPHTPSLLNLATEWNIPRDIRKKIIGYLGPLELLLVFYAHLGKTAAQRDLYLFTAVAHSAAYNGNIELLKWAISISQHIPRLSRIAGGGGHMDVIDFLTRASLLNPVDAMAGACLEGRINVIDKLYEKGKYSQFLKNWMAMAYERNQDLVLNHLALKLTEEEGGRPEVHMDNARILLDHNRSIARERVEKLARSQAHRYAMISDTPSGQKRILELEYDNQTLDEGYLLHVSTEELSAYDMVMEIDRYEAELRDDARTSILLLPSSILMAGPGMRDAYLDAARRVKGKHKVFGLVTHKMIPDKKIIKTRICNITPGEGLECMSERFMTMDFVIAVLGGSHANKKRKEN